MPVAGLVVDAAQALETKEHEVGIGRVGLAVIPYRFDAPCLERLPDLRAVHSELSRKPEQARKLVKRRVATALIEGQQIHEIEMPRVIAAEVVVEAELAVVFARVPIARRRQPVDEE